MSNEFMKEKRIDKKNRKNNEINQRGMNRQNGILNFLLIFLGR